jgi:hypothetical protein
LVSPLILCFVLLFVVNILPFLVDVESVGIIPSRRIFLESSEILRGKAAKLIKEIEQKQNQE